MAEKSPDGPDFNFSDGRSWQRVQRETILGAGFGVPLIALIAGGAIAIVGKLGDALFSLLPWSFDPGQWVSQPVQEKTANLLVAARDLFEAIRLNVTEAIPVSLSLQSVIGAGIVFLGMVFLVYHLMIVDALVAEILALHKKQTLPSIK